MSFAVPGYLPQLGGRRPSFVVNIWHVPTVVSICTVRLGFHLNSFLPKILKKILLSVLFSIPDLSRECLLQRLFESSFALAQMFIGTISNV